MTAVLLSSSHAVSRSSELLSCAKTALKIAQSQHADASPEENNPVLQQSPNQLSLYNHTADNLSDSSISFLLEDGLALLRQMKLALETLSSLVKRRGHTNDPTLEMQRQLDDFQHAARELSTLQIVPTRIVSQQQARHYQLVSAWFQAAASVYTSELQQVMKLRAQVLSDLALQRQKLLHQNGTSFPKNQQHSTRRNVGFPTSSSAMNSPLFTAVSNHTTMNTTMNKSTTTGSNGAPPLQQQHSAPASFPTNGTSSSTVGYGGTTTTTHATSGYYASYGGAGASYGGTTTTTTTTATGIRQRKAVPASFKDDTQTEHDDNNDNVQGMLQEQQQRRDTRNRLHQARQAESTLAELGTLFGKMSTLISQQGEVVNKVEDDVEAALGNVGAGEQEIQTLYTIKRGNRGLILKVFGILIFLIIFMRFY